jgi:putative PIN family toxin of toxin-antitoxin system
LRVVIDTSALVSYLLTRGKLMRLIFSAWQAGEIDLVISPQTLEELVTVIARPEIAQRAGESLTLVRDRLSQWVIHVPGTLDLPGACRDPKDDKFLACAVEGQVDYLISSDRDLLDMGVFQGVCILNPGQFVAALQLARLSVEVIQADYSLQALQTIRSELRLDAVTQQKLVQAIEGLEQLTSQKGSIP